MNTASYSEQAISKGSLSFALASRVFARDVRSEVHKLYAWCRYVDDQTDASGLSTGQRLRALETLAEQSFDAIAAKDLPPAVQAFREMSDRAQLPQAYAEDLLKGMAMDLNGQRYPDLQALALYCYRVAGVVGLMMSHLMKVKDPEAAQHAMDLGQAMQLTNIARDVADDARMGRIYIPENWLREAGLPPLPEEILKTERQYQLVPVVERLLKEADRLYLSGDRGLRYLPFRCAVAVGIAREVYAAIGDEVRARGAAAWQSRVIISLPHKLWLALKGFGKALQTVPYRWKRKSNV